jgi:hypothetical protein
VSLPRWQWRTFGDDLTCLSSRLAAPDLGRGRWTDEVHLVCLQSSHHAWLVRDTLELLWRKEVGPDGFELWDPILRAALPFEPAAVSQLFAAWGLAKAWPGRGFAETDSFVSAIEAAAPSVRAVRLARRRERTSIDGIECSFETVTAGTGGSAARCQSFAVEHEDPTVIAHALRTLGLDTRDNINFVQGLKQALGLAGDRH